MEEAIIDQIPGYEKGKVQYVGATDEVSALFISAQMVSDLLNRWNTTTAFFSATGRSGALLELAKNTSATARLVAADQKNGKLGAIIRKAVGMSNRRSVRAVVIEGVPEPDPVSRRTLEMAARSSGLSVTIVTVDEREQTL